MLNVKRIVQFISIFTLLITIANTIRLPNTYAKAHWLLSYRFGFIKRGLIGSIFNSLEIPLTENLIAVFSLSILAFFCFAFIFIASEFLNNLNFNREAQLITLAFFSSPFISISGHLVGYFDALVYILAILSIMLVFQKKFFLCSIIHSIGILIHETYVLIGLPVTFLAFMLANTSSEKFFYQKKFLNLFLIPILVFSIFVFNSYFVLELAMSKEKLRESLSSYAFITSHIHVIVSMETDSFYQLLKMHSSTFIYRFFNRPILSCLIPSLVVLIYFIYSKFQIKLFSMLSFAIIVIILCPLLMNFIAYDTARISFNSIGISFLVIWILSKTKQSFFQKNYFIYLFTIPTIFLNFFLHIPLMDEAKENFSREYMLLIIFPCLLLILYNNLKNNKISAK